MSLGLPNDEVLDHVCVGCNHPVCNKSHIDYISSWFLISCHVCDHMMIYVKNLHNMDVLLLQGTIKQIECKAP